jgi:hypothetical protein
MFEKHHKMYHNCFVHCHYKFLFQSHPGKQHSQEVNIPVMQTENAGCESWLWLNVTLFSPQCWMQTVTYIITSTYLLLQCSFVIKTDNKAPLNKDNQYK